MPRRRDRELPSNSNAFSSATAPAGAAPELGRIWTIANGITVFRILLAAPFVYCITRDRNDLALGVFFLASITDFLDGYSARKLGQPSALGRFLDPAADKVLTTVSYVALAFRGGAAESIPVWLASLVVGRDIVILTGALIVYLLRGFTSFRPSWLGKANTFAELALIIAFLAFSRSAAAIPVLRVSYVCVGALICISGIEYVIRGIQILSAPKSGAATTIRSI